MARKTFNWSVLTAPKLLLSIMRGLKPLKVEITKGKNSDSLYVIVEGTEHHIQKAIGSYQAKIACELSYEEKKSLQALRSYNKTDKAFDRYNFTYQPSKKEFGYYSSQEWEIDTVEDFLQKKDCSDSEFLPKRINYESFGNKKTSQEVKALKQGYNLVKSAWNLQSFRKTIYGSKRTVILAKKLNITVNRYINMLCWFIIRENGLKPKTKRLATLYLRSLGLKP